MSAPIPDRPAPPADALPLEVAPARPPAGPRVVEAPEARALAELRADLATVRGSLAVAMAERDGARSTVDAQRVALDVSGQRAAELARSLEVERARVAGLEAELAALRGAGSTCSG